MLCKICEQEESKYKCPSCKAPYCSLVCYKKHKEIPCTETANEETKEEGSSRKEIKIVAPPDEEDPSRLTPEDLQKLLYSDDVKEFLKYPQIREIIRQIDTSKTPEKDLDYVRNHDEKFDELTKKLVEITYKDKLEASNKKK